MKNKVTLVISVIILEFKNGSILENHFPKRCDGKKKYGP